MNQSVSCLQPQEVDSLLEGDLTPEELAHAEEHLTGCEACRSAIEQAIGSEQWWRDVRCSLSTQNGDPHATEELRQEFGEDRAPVAKLLELLGPTDDPAMLGRIGPYEITGVLGQGGMGAVFKGFDRSLNRFVAIKMLLPHLAAIGAARQRFAREGQAVAAVVDDHVMAIHCVSEWQGVPYLVMTYARGASLQKRLGDHGPLELREVLRIGRQAAKGLAAAHAQGIVHRDVKPANIFLDENVERVQLMDFGLARAVDDASLTRSGMLAGTPQYMSPEQARGERVDKRSDLFSLGAVLYAMCVGHAPFRAESSYGVLRLITDVEPRPIRETNPDIPEWLCQLIAKLMSKRAEDRYQSAAEVAALLESCLAHVQQPTDAPLPSSLSPSPKRRRIVAFSRRSLGVIAAIAAATSSVLAVFFVSTTAAPDIAGRWISEDWGPVRIEPTQPGQYEGTFAAVVRDDRTPLNVEWSSIGAMRLQWSWIERRYNGTWRVGDRASGRVSLRLVDGEIRGALTTSRSAQGRLETPRLSDLLWTRAISAPTGSRSESAGGLAVELSADRVPLPPAKPNEETRIYHIEHLPLWTRDGKQQNAALLLQYLKTIDVASWADGTTRAAYDADQRSLVVSTTNGIHEEFARVLNGGLSKAAPPAETPIPPDVQYTVAYPIADLPLWTRDGKFQGVELLIKYLRLEAKVATWNDGGIHASYFGDKHQLIVASNSATHQKLAGALAALRVEMNLSGATKSTRFRSHPPAPEDAEP
ncbi:MAG: protein kinase [Pirellulaceae bacterium]